MIIMDFELEDLIRKDKHLMNRLTWEAEHGTTKRPEDAARSILSHPKRGKRFQMLYSEYLSEHGHPDRNLAPANETDPLTFAVVHILSELREW